MRGVRVADGVRERLLGDPVDDQLDVLRQGTELLGLEPRLDPALAGELAHVARQRRLEPEVVERRRAQLARQGEQLLHRLVGERPDLGELGGELGGAFSRAASSRSSRPVSDWLTSSWRSRATRARSSSCAASAALEARRRSASSRSSIRAKAWCSRATSSGSAGVPIALRFAPGRERSARSIWSTSCSSGWKRRWSRSTLKRIVSADREPEDERRLGRVEQPGVGIGGDRRRDNRGHDQQQVDEQDLGEKVAAAHAT